MIFLGLKFRILIHGIGLCRFRSLLRKVGPFNNEYPSFCVLILLHSMDFFKDSNGGSISWKRKYLQFFNGFYNFIFTLIKMLTLLHIRDIIHSLYIRHLPTRH